MLPPVPETRRQPRKDESQRVDDRGDQCPKGHDESQHPRQAGHLLRQVGQKEASKNQGPFSGVPLIRINIYIYMDHSINWGP